MRLIVPTPEELRQALVDGAAVWRTPTRACDDDAAPPPIVLRRSLENITTHPEQSTWFAPRLFWAEDAGAIVGSSCFKTAPNDPNAVEIGYGVGPRHQGRGYATAAVRLIIAEAFALSSAGRICAMVRPDNRPSARVLMKCGFLLNREVPDVRDGVLLRFQLFRS